MGSMFRFDSRRGRASHVALVLLQVFLLLFLSVGHGVVLAAEPEPPLRAARLESPAPDPSPSGRSPRGADR